jgi:hypothetical protein
MPDAMMSRTDPRFHDAFNRSSFLFDHDLNRHPLYDLDSLVGLARRLGPHQAYWSNRPADLADGWGHLQARERSLEAAVAGIEACNALVRLNGIEEDRVFGPVFASIVAEMTGQVGPQLQTDLVNARGALVITSPRRVIGYHIDAQPKFLLQLRGSRTLCVYDGSDRNVMPDAELEAFYSGHPFAVRYKDDHQGTAREVGFQPGMGVHIPVEWPHWFRNGNSLSVTMNISYELRSSAQRARIYKVNHRLRRFGLIPSPPGAHPWRDLGKVALVAGLERITHRAV